MLEVITVSIANSYMCDHQCSSNWFEIWYSQL